MNKYTSLSPEELHTRTKKHAIRCAQHFERLGMALIKESAPPIDFKKKSIEEIDAWIAEVTSALGIRQFNK